MRCSIAFALSLLLALAARQAVQAEQVAPAARDGAADAEVASLDDLLARFARLQGMSARYREEKRIALLKRPLQSEGSIQFAAPNLLLRRVERPEPAVMLLAGDTLQIADATGARRIDLQGNPMVRHFVLTFVHVLSGDRAALERLYALSFTSGASSGAAPPARGWRLELTPRQPELARMIERATLVGQGPVVEQMTLQERNGDTTVLSFSDVDLGVRFDAAARARIFRLPGK
jgi:outer membrane lipoprotein-sorting protein